VSRQSLAHRQPTTIAIVFFLFIDKWTEEASCLRCNCSIQSQTDAAVSVWAYFDLFGLQAGHRNVALGLDL
jgi:hypothetical protein